MNTAFNNWCTLPTPMGEFRMYDTGNEDIRIICLGDIMDQGSEPLLRVHSSCIASEVFGALDCDCADQLQETMKLIASEGRGVVLHLHQEGRGQGLSLKIKAVRAMEVNKQDTVEAFDSLGLEQDIRCYAEAVNILEKVGINSVRLISNNPRKASFLKNRGIQVNTVNTNPTIRPENEEYLHSKNNKLGHKLPLDTATQTSSPINFYHSDQPWGELSNFSRHSMFIDGKIWPTAEHYYQAQKYKGTTHEEDIRQCSTPILAKIKATSLVLKRLPNWSEIKENIMLKALRAKFQQHPDLKIKLLNSGTRLLVEHTKNDNYWGDSGDGSGLNRLGHLLMQVRKELS